MLLFFVFPLVYIGVISFFTNKPLGLMRPDLTLENYIRIIESDLYRDVLLSTVEMSLIATIITVVAGYQVAYFIVFSNKSYSKALILVVIAPMLVGNVVRAFGWFALMDTNGFVNSALGFFGLQYTLMQTKPGFLIAVCSVLMPFATLIIMSVLYSIDRDLLEAGYNLGGNPLQTFCYVTLPLSLPGVVGAVLITFVLVMGTFATAVFIGMPNVPMLAPYVYQTTGELNWPLASALSIILFSVSFALVVLYVKINPVQSGAEGGLL
jgi:putative spermidine/putrescine transport system permease protein